MLPPAFGTAQSNSDALRSGGSPSIDTAPPHMPPRPAGADTASLLGDRPDSDITGGAGMQSPEAQIVAAIAMMMSGANIYQSLLPGHLSPQFLMELQQASVTGPDAIQQLTSMQGPMMGLMGAAQMNPGGNGIGGAPPGMPGMSQPMNASAGMQPQQQSGIPQRM